MTTLAKVFCAVLMAGFCVVGADSASATKVLFHGREFEPTFGDDGFVFDHLVGTYGEENVTYMMGLDAAADGSSADGFDVVIVSSSMPSSALRDKYEDSPVGIVNWENALIHDNDVGNFMLSDEGGNENESSTLTQIDIVDSSHPLAAGLSGTVTVYSSANWHQYGLGTLGAGVSLIASSSDNPERHAIFAADVGGALLGDGSDGSPDTAAGRRVMFFLSDFGFSTLTNDGLSLFNAAVNWAAGVNVVEDTLQAGDANQDLEFDQFDIIQVSQGGKYLTGQPATWGEGDWDGAPGGTPGDPPLGDGLFNQVDIIEALSPGLYLTGPYAAIASGGSRGDEQTSIIYDAGTGEVAIDAPASTELTSINIDSAAAIFTGGPAQNLGGSFDNDADNNIFKATFGSSFGSLSFGSVAQAGLSEEFMLNDLTVIGSLAGGGDLGIVDLIYIPEPSTVVLLSFGLASVVGFSRGFRTSRGDVDRNYWTTSGPT